jgi:TolB-like protein/DNA-binding winged helix-turn-helix (wHTH) protein
MNTSTTAKLRIGAWNVEPEMGQMTRNGETVRLEPRMMRLLLCLAERANQTVSADQLLDQVWPGVVVSPDSVYQAIASLRRLLGDDPKQASYIVTVPRKGYRMVAEVGAWREPETVPPALIDVPTAVRTTSAWYMRHRITAVVCAGLAAVIVAALWIHDRPASIASAGINFAYATPAQKSIAVLPFLDLTEEMKQEYFADGITEELIGRFSKIPGFKVPAPTASFYYKGKQITVGEFARNLDVRYVLDGSVRKSGATMRIAARLMKADNGFVIWSATYDRPVDDLLMVQDDIAEQVTKALVATVNEEGASSAKSAAR